MEWPGIRWNGLSPVTQPLVRRARGGVNLCETLRPSPMWPRIIRELTNLEARHGKRMEARANKMLGRVTIAQAA